LTWEDTSAATDDYWWTVDAVAGTPPTGDVAYLTDVVGSRTVKVTAGTVIGGTPYEVSEVITFGDGPLSVFTKAPQTGLKWAEQNGVAGSKSRNATGVFTDSTNSFPAAHHCGGTVNNDSSVVVVTGASPPFGMSISGAGWRAGDRWSTGYYSTSSGLPTFGQLLAVSRYDGGNNPNDPRKGAALAAGWPNDVGGGNNYGYWTGQVDFSASGCFYAVGVGLTDGGVYFGVFAGAVPVAVCAAP
jgi:hypothetical protein